MNIIGVQLVLLAFALFMVYVLYLHWKKKNISNKTFYLWIFIWLTFIFFTFFPSTLEPLIKNLFIVRVMDFAMIGAFMFLTFITIENGIRVKQLEKNIEYLVREFSIDEKKEK